MNLDAMVSDIVPLMHASIPRTVRLQLLPAGDLPFVEADEGQLQQILMNLVSNGAEAIAASAPGTLTIATESRRPTAAETQRAVIPLPDAAAHYVALSVSDTGSGMDAATVAHIFDPFFTTRFAGRGLGLSAVMGIFKAHSGTLIIESLPGKGTTFRVFLPVAPKQADTFQVPALFLLWTMKRRCSHSPQTRSNMPGDKAAPEIRRLRPGIRSLLSSGCGELEARERFNGIGTDVFLQKPYTAA